MKRFIENCIVSIIVLVVAGVMVAAMLSDVEAAENNGKECGQMEQILPNLYVLKDVCNVYLLKAGDEGLVIDSGSGAVVECAGEVGVEKIDWVLHTHNHREQCYGDGMLIEQGAKVAIGKGEAWELGGVDGEAGGGAPYDGWGGVPRREGVFAKAGVDRELVGGDVIEWGGYRIEVIDTPGHTKGSVSYVVEVDGKKVVFGGDLILKDGHARNLYSMQWVYLSNPGVGESLVSLDKIAEVGADMILASHGDVISDVDCDIAALSVRLRRYDECIKPDGMGRWNWSDLVEVYPRVIQDCGSTTRVVLSESGEAFMFDCGGYDEAKMKDLREKYGMTDVKVIMASHWHGDHINGIAKLVEETGAEVWMWEGLAEHIEHPERFITTCRRGRGIKVDRVLKENEEFEWGGYQFKVIHQPAHMEEQMALKVKVGEINFLLHGDSFGGTRNQPLRCAIHCYNGITLKSGIIKTVRTFYDAGSYVSVTPHGNCYAAVTTDKDKFLEWGIETTAAIRDLLGGEHADVGYNPYWATYYPVTTSAKGGESVDVVLRIVNDAERGVSGVVWPRCYGDVEFEVDKVGYEAKAGEVCEIPLSVKVKREARKGIHVLTADVEYDGELFGEPVIGYVVVE